MVIRPASRDDSDHLARLAGQLGYPVAIGVMRERLDRLTPIEAHFIRVAEDERGRIIGWVHAGEEDLLESGRRCEIFGLVVDQAARGQGVGRALVAAVEAWAAGRRLPEITVRSNVVRDSSHAFYPGCGYRRTKTQHVYRKDVSGASAGDVTAD